MDNLISGLIGALITTIITVVYLHLSELIRRRHDVALEVVGFSDDVYSYLQIMHVYRGQIFNGKDISDPDEYHIASKKLRSLVLSSRLHARAALVYGEESSELAALQELRNHYIESARLLWNSNKDNWVKTNDELASRFKNKIDPLRSAIEIQFIRSVRIRNILKDWALNAWPIKVSAGKDK